MGLWDCNQFKLLLFHILISTYSLLVFASCSLQNTLILYFFLSVHFFTISYGKRALIDTDKIYLFVTHDLKCAVHFLISYFCEGSVSGTTDEKWPWLAEKPGLYCVIIRQSFLLEERILPVHIETSGFWPKVSFTWIIFESKQRYWKTNMTIKHEEVYRVKTSIYSTFSVWFLSSNFFVFFDRQHER